MLCFGFKKVVDYFFYARSLDFCSSFGPAASLCASIVAFEASQGTELGLPYSDLTHSKPERH